MSLDDEELFDFLFYLFIYSCDEPMKVANWKKKTKEKKKKFIQLIELTKI
jgi:hypothetical protein